MNRRDFSTQGWVRIVRNTAGTDACLPRNLPPEIKFDAALALGVRPQSAQNNIEHLVFHGILREITGLKRNRVYAADAILRILEQTPALDVPERPEELA